MGGAIGEFLSNNLKIELHPEKSRVVSLSKGVDFVGFRIFYHNKRLRIRNIRKVLRKIKDYRENKISKEKLLEIFSGWNAYAIWSNSFKLRKKIVKEIYNQI